MDEKSNDVPRNTVREWFRKADTKVFGRKIKDDFRIEKNPEKNEIFILTARR